MSLSPRTLHTHLRDLLLNRAPSLLSPNTKPRFLVAFSGGLDSTVLLHLMAALRVDLNCDVCAVHVHHGLQLEADAWPAHCEAVCGDLNVYLQLLRVNARPAVGESPEAAARAARYSALTQAMTNSSILLTAHHQDDQAETLLLQLLRGAGPRGLAAMPEWDDFGVGYQARPLLRYSRAQLLAYAQENGLKWIEDPSNAQVHYDRNFLRHYVMPLLQQRWPAAAVTLARSAAVCADASHVLDDVAAIDLLSVSVESSPALSVSGLLTLSPSRRRNALMQWFAQQGLPGPASAHLVRIEADVLAARPDANPCVGWPGVSVRRYRDGLYALVDVATESLSGSLDWNGEPLIIPGYGRFSATPVVGKGISDQVWRSGPLQIRFRNGGERFRQLGAVHHRTLKNWLQENAIPPWERAVLPLVYAGATLIGIGNVALAHGVLAGPEELGWVLVRS